MKHKKKRRSPQQALEIIARQEGTSVEEVRREIERAAHLGMLHSDPDVRAAWNALPASGDRPTAEETIAYFLSLVDEGSPS